MLCVSLSGSALEAVGAAMKLTRPQVYNFSLSPSAQAALPTLYSVAATGAYVDTALQLLCACVIAAMGGESVCVFGGGVDQRVRCCIKAMGNR
jgi:hypothetical protein